MPRLLPVALLLAALALGLAAPWRWTAPASAPPAPARADAPPAVREEPETADPLEPTPLPRQSVVIYFPGSDSNGLVGEEREIFDTGAPGDRAKQILIDLIAGPQGSRATPAVPPGTLLRQVYVLDNGVAYIDFSTDLELAIGVGSSEELLTIYAIVDSVALNVREIKKVGILVNGRPVETLNGHVDLRRPLPPDRSYILGERTGPGAEA